MNASDNKKLMQYIFDQLSQGNDQPFIDSMADTMRWTWMGSGQWSKTFDGKQAVLGELWAAVRTTLKSPYKVIANRFIADDDYVVVEATGQNTTPDGKLYNNKYCWVCHITEGKLQELNEYMDTQLVTETFQG
ncbi:nuclear transport factor 2 family protein [Xanthocytophaga flava]|nr:nuclear transport factor 2 family protein [Xanthocytophaga flavus]